MHLPTLTRADITDLINVDRATEFGDTPGWQDDINNAFARLASRHTQALAIRIVMAWARMSVARRADAWHATDGS